MNNTLTKTNPTACDFDQILDATVEARLGEAERFQQWLHRREIVREAARRSLADRAEKGAGLRRFARVLAAL